MMEDLVTAVAERTSHVVEALSELCNSNHHPTAGADSTHHQMSHLVRANEHVRSALPRNRYPDTSNGRRRVPGGRYARTKPWPPD